LPKSSRQLIFLVIVGVAGARLMHVLVEENPLDPSQPILYHYIEHPAEIFDISNGLAFYGAVLLCLPVAAWYLRRKQMPLAASLDIYALCVPVGLFFGRLGCFLAGCCHGTPTDLPWGVIYSDPESLARPLGTPLHPVQLYSAAFALLLFGVLWLARSRAGDFPGRSALLLGVLYPAGRFLLEFVRGDIRGMFFGGRFSSSQLLSLVVLAVCASWLVVRGRRKTD